MEKVFNSIKKTLKGILIFLTALVVIGVSLYLYYYSVNFIFKNILPFASRAVLANFILFGGIICFVMFKFANAPAQIEKMQDEIAESIENSKNTKAESETKLSAIEESLTHIEEEIDSILKDSEVNAKLVGDKILDEAQKTALIIQENSGKAIENSRRLLKNELIKRASLASVEVAKARIMEELNKNSELHDRLIDESINLIEGISIE